MTSPRKMPSCGTVVLCTGHVVHAVGNQREVVLVVFFVFGRYLFEKTNSATLMVCFLGF